MISDVNDLVSAPSDDYFLSPLFFVKENKIKKIRINAVVKHNLLYLAVLTAPEF
jgi:hypothetical protein